MKWGILPDFLAMELPARYKVQDRFLRTSPDTAPVMRAKRAEVAAKGYAGFLLQ